MGGGMQCPTLLKNGRTLHIVVYSFKNLLSFGFGNETKISGISEPVKFHVRQKTTVWESTKSYSDPLSITVFPLLS